MSPWPISTVRSPLVCSIQTCRGRASKWAAASVGYSYRVSDDRQVGRAQLLRDSPDSCWRRGGRRYLQYFKKQLRVWIWGPREAKSSFASQMDRQELHILRSLEGQLEVISEVPEGSIRFSPDGRLPHTPSSVRLAALDERYSGVKRLCIVYSQIRGRTREFASPSGEGTVCEKGSEESTTKRDRGLLRSVNAKPNSRQQCCLAQDFAGRLVALEVRGVAPIKTPGGSDSALLGIPAASRKTSGPALHEARTLLGVGAEANRIRIPVSLTSKRRYASSPTSRPCRGACGAGSSSGQTQKLALARGRARSGSGYGIFRNGVHRGSQRLGGHAQPVTNTLGLSSRRTRREYEKTW